MNNNININLKFNVYGNLECISDETDKIDPIMKLKMDALVKRVLLESHIPLDQIESICVDQTSNGMKFSIIPLEQKNIIHLENSLEILRIARDVFKEKDESTWQKVVFNIPQKVPQKAPILPKILNTSNPVPQRIMAHIHAGEFGKESSLEGSQQIIMLEFLAKFLKDRSIATNPYGISLELQTQIYNATLKDLSRVNIGTFQQQIINCIRSQKPLLMSGGWIGSPGHTIYYEIVPGQDKKTTLRIFNLGSGIELNEGVTKGIKEKTAPVVEWQGISNSNLLSDQFYKVFRELSKHVNIPNTSSPTSYEGTDIYGALKELLNPEIETVIYSKENESISMTPQRAGMCSWKSLMAFLRTKMDEKNYKIFKCDVKLQTLIDSYNFLDRNSTLSEDARWRLVQKSLASTSRTIDKLYESGAVGKEYVIRAHELLLPVHQWVKKNKGSTLINYEVPDVQQLQYHLPGIINWRTSCHFERGTPLSLMKPGEGISQKKGIIIEKMKIIQSKPLESKDINSTLDNILSISKQAWFDKNDSENHLGLNQLISLLPIDQAFWVDAANNSPGKAEELILHLGKLQALYFKTCWTIPSAEIVFPERVLGIYKLAFIMHHLAQIIAPNQWPDIKPMSNLRNSLESHLFNLKKEEEANEIYRWVHKGVNILFDPDSKLYFDSAKELTDISVIQ